MDDTLQRNSKRACLLQLKRFGLNPSFVIDVGANSGTPELYEVFPESRHILIEPLVEHEPALAEICQRLSNAMYFIAGAASKSGTSDMWTIAANDRSELIEPNQNIPQGAERRSVNCITIDELVEMQKLRAPGLLKIDVDGREPDVLKGTSETMQLFECIVIEVALYGKAHEIIGIMREHNFALYDILEPMYRPKDAVLWQVDMAFVKADGQFRKNNTWQ